MMHSRLFTVVLALPLLFGALPVAAQYLQPEDVLQQNDPDFLIPGRVRGAQWWAAMQDEQNKERHPSILNEPWDPAKDAGIPPPLNQNTDMLGNASIVQQEATPWQDVDPLTARLLERLTRDNILRSQTVAMPSTAGAAGAPLAGTGPAGVLTVLVMVAASVWTLRKARVLEKFVREV